MDKLLEMQATDLFLAINETLAAADEKLDEFGLPWRNPVRQNIRQAMQTLDYIVTTKKKGELPQ